MTKTLAGVSNWTNFGAIDPAINNNIVYILTYKESSEDVKFKSVYIWTRFILV